MYSTCNNKLLNEPFSSKELIDALDRLDVTKACGPDGIHGIMLKQFPHFALNRLLNVFNLCFMSNKLPGDFSMVSVTPILKSIKREDQANSF